MPAKKKAAPKKAAPKKAAPKKAAPQGTGIPSRLALGKRNAGNDEDAAIYDLSKSLMALTGQSHVTRGNLAQVLTYTAKVTENKDEANDMIADAVDAGVLKPTTPAKGKAKSEDEESKD